MSEMETHTGKLIPVYIGDSSLEYIINSIFNDAESDGKDFCDSLVTEYEGDLLVWVDREHPDYIVKEGILYMISDVSRRECAASSFVGNNDGSISYYLRFYSGFDLDECIREGLNDLEIGDD